MSPGLLTQQVYAVVVRNRGNPLPKWLFNVVLAKVLVRSHKRFLGSILRQFAGIQQSAAQPEHSNVVVSVENLKGCVSRHYKFRSFKQLYDADRNLLQRRRKSFLGMNRRCWPKAPANWSVLSGCFLMF
jgi:hypothetical protein